MRDADLAPGTMAGDYRVDSRIGAGGMGTVYQATQPVIGKRVALKVLRRDLCANAAAVARFIQEARAVNQIGHPNIVDVFGFGTTEDGRAFLVMELLAGENLATRAKREPVPLAALCDVLIEITHALEAAHAAGIVHRDLKPDNIFLGTKGVKLLDFGIAKLTSSGGTRDETSPGIIMGTPRYISPEQVRGGTIDGRTDVYALGVVLFELVAGRPPFVAGDSHELVEKHATLRPPPPSAFNPALPPAIDKLVAAMLAKEPSARPSIPEVRAALVELRGAKVAAPVAQAGDQATQLIGASVTGTATDAVTIPQPARPRRRWPIVAAASAAAAAIIAIVVLQGGSPASDQPPAPPVAATPAPPVPRAPDPVAPEPIADPAITVEDPAPVKVAKPPPRNANPKPRPRPADPRPARPAAVEDDDAVRSPFDKKTKP